MPERTQEELDRGLEGWAPGYEELYTAASEHLSQIAKRLSDWAVSVGHDASKMSVPKWCQPLPPKAPSVLKVDGLSKEQHEAVLFELPVRVKKKPSRTSVKARKERKTQRDAWAAVKK